MTAAPEKLVAGRPPVATLNLARLFAAPRELLFDAWVRPEHLARWWGPQGFSAPRCEVEPRAGGPFSIAMRGPDGTDYPFSARIVEVAPPERLVFEGLVHDRPGSEVRTTVTFAPEGQGTRLSVEQLYAFEDAATRGAEAGWTQSLARLEAQLATADRELVATRLLPAPPTRVWRALAEPDQLARWWGPKGFRNSFERCEPRPGGAWRFVMHGPDGKDYPNECAFVELLEPVRVALDHLSAPRFRLTFTLAGEGAGTRVTMQQLFETPALLGRVKAFAAPANDENLERLAGVVAAGSLNLAPSPARSG